MMTKKATAAFLILFLVASFLFISSEKNETRIQYHSSQLQKMNVKDGVSERTDFLNSDGKLTVAADVGYATVIATNGEGTRLEHYYDEQGEPICRSSGYYAVLREYDDSGNNVRNTYLDQQMEPIVTLSGYAIEEREYNARGQLVSKKYYDTEGHPATLLSYEHGQINEYGEDGRISRTIYIDADGNPMMTRQGYAIIRFFYYTSGSYYGKIDSELYYDAEDNPVSLSLGEYGLHKEYDSLGRSNVWTYLDAEGIPTVTNKGYTTVVRTFQANNYVATERYLDIDGNPFSLPEGQYGVKTINGQTVYLDENGNEQFNLKNLLYNYPQIIIVVAMTIVLLTVAVNKNWNTLFAIGYIIAIAYLTLMFRESGVATLKFEPFSSYRKIFSDSETRADILKNIWLFIPLGAILYRIYPNTRILLIPAALSILIEAIQYFAGIGYCELDDVISNGLGGAIGYGMGCQAKKIRDLFLNERHKRLRTAKN